MILVKTWTSYKLIQKQYNQPAWYKATYKNTLYLLLGFIPVLWERDRI
jgi:hypothetical protein